MYWPHRDATVGLIATMYFTLNKYLLMVTPEAALGHGEDAIIWGAQKFDHIIRFFSFLC